MALDLDTALTGIAGFSSRPKTPNPLKLVESFMKLLRLEDAYLMECETFEDVADGVPRVIEACNTRRLHSALGTQFENRHACKPVKTAA